MGDTLLTINKVAVSPPQHKNLSVSEKKKKKEKKEIVRKKRIATHYQD